MEYTMPVEVRVVVRDRTLDGVGDLLQMLQDIADDWYWKQVPIIPCSLVKKSV